MRYHDNYRLTLAGNALAQGLDIVANHPDVSQCVSQKNFYVAEKIIAELPPLLQRYSFDLKRILKSYEQCEGVTNTESQEQILGLVWNFIEDTLRPNMQIFLSKKKRGEHLEPRGPGKNTNYNAHYLASSWESL